ncbi:MAG TPA: hypothetical protein VFQ80_14875 [Thermomicrobiales bacterium]|nr:hypothetical protein [Thermomicrobiales bacterium]
MDAASDAAAGALVIGDDRLLHRRSFMRQPRIRLVRKPGRSAGIVACPDCAEQIAGGGDAGGRMIEPSPTGGALADQAGRHRRRPPGVVASSICASRARTPARSAGANVDERRIERAGDCVAPRMTVNGVRSSCCARSWGVAVVASTSGKSRREAIASHLGRAGGRAVGRVATQNTCHEVTRSADAAFAAFGVASVSAQSGDLDCHQFSSWQEANATYQNELASSGWHWMQLDEDGDSLPCECLSYGYHSLVDARGLTA